MKKLISFSAFLLLALITNAQEGVKLQDLALPNSPGFILTDLTPSLVQTPNTPRKFILGLAQSFDKSSSGFPDNYSAEFAPYWFINPDGKSVYAAVGLNTKIGEDQKLKIGSEDIFSGLKFTSLSVSFIHKDLIPDNVDVSQKVFALGIKTTLIKVPQSGYAQKINNLISQWHEAAQKDLEDFNNQKTSVSTQLDLDNLLKNYMEKKGHKSLDLAKQIGDLYKQKPKFVWDFAGAYATYGIDNEPWKSGRTGIWSTLSYYAQLAGTNNKPSNNYVSLSFSARSLWDNFAKDENNNIVKTNNIDVGGKVGIDLDDLSLGVESLYRYINGRGGNENRTVGIVTYKITENIILTGAFGKNFESLGKSIALFSINWGFGSEKINLPDK
ncbi:hypothetical protein [Mucilaginibacter sp.]|jgi:hypothetical protein|uniref:hypothetical protein n=1 Tax=Mucilaginibacter sp. TaxID=1882438 RepID=UPI0025FC6598|nr:hypothetical protein [Mucilaginibacter sp.]